MELKEFRAMNRRKDGVRAGLDAKAVAWTAIVSPPQWKREFYENNSCPARPSQEKHLADTLDSTPAAHAARAQRIVADLPPKAGEPTIRLIPVFNNVMVRTWKEEEIRIETLGLGVHPIKAGESRFVPLEDFEWIKCLPIGLTFTAEYSRSRQYEMNVRFKEPMFLIDWTISGGCLFPEPGKPSPNKFRILRAGTEFIFTPYSEHIANIFDTKDEASAWAETVKRDLLAKHRRHCRQHDDTTRPQELSPAV